MLESLAIQFVLAHEFQHLSQQKLADMLYVSSAGGPAVSCGYVEIIFDNNDRQLPVLIDNGNRKIIIRPNREMSHFPL